MNNNMAAARIGMTFAALSLGKTTSKDMPSTLSINTSAQYNTAVCKIRSSGEGYSSYVTCADKIIRRAYSILNDIPAKDIKVIKSLIKQYSLTNDMVRTIVTAASEEAARLAPLRTYSSTSYRDYDELYVRTLADMILKYSQVH